MTTSNRIPGVFLTLIVVVPAVLLSAGDPAFWGRYLQGLRQGSPRLAAGRIDPRVTVVGGAGQAVARADAVAESLAPEAIEAALTLAREQGARALLIHRHGHRITEQYGAGVSAATQVAGGELSPLPLALAWGSLVESARLDGRLVKTTLQDLYADRTRERWRNPWAREAQRYFSSQPTALADALPVMQGVPELISQSVWQPLGANDAGLWGTSGELHLECCFVAQLGDWMRLADLLLLEGQYAGERIVSAQWIRELLVGDTGPVRRLAWVEAAAPFSGDEPAAARDAVGIDLQADVRLWLSPQRGLAILVWAREGSGLASDTALPNIVFRGMVDQLSTPAVAPVSDIVPGH